MFRNILLSLCASTAIIITGGLQSVYAPSSAMAITLKDQSIINIAQKFLEPKAKLLNSNTVKLKNGIVLADIDGDKKNEAIVFYKNKNEAARAGIMILKQTPSQKWNKIYQYTSEGSDLNYLKISDFNKDGKYDVLVGWHIGSIYNKLDILLWNNGKVLRIDGGPYSKIYVQDMPDINGHTDGKEEIALWLHDTGEAYIINIYRLNGVALVLAKDVYPNYFKTVVVPFYEQKVKEMPGAAFYLYYLADAQIKSGDPKGALTSIEKGLKILSANPDYYPDRTKFEKLKVQAENMLSRNH